MAVVTAEAPSRTPSVQVLPSLDMHGVFVVVVTNFDLVCPKGVHLWEHTGQMEKVAVTSGLNAKWSQHAVYVVNTWHDHHRMLNAEKLAAFQIEIEESAKQLLVPAPPVTVYTFSDGRPEEPWATLHFDIDWGNRRNHLFYHISQALLELQRELLGKANPYAHVLGNITAAWSDDEPDSALEVTVQVGLKDWREKRMSAEKYFNDVLETLIPDCIRAVHREHYTPR